MGFKQAILKKLEKNLAAIFPIRSQKKFLAARPSVDGAENGPRFIMVQGIIPQPMILLSTGVSELTLGAE